MRNILLVTILAILIIGQARSQNQPIALVGGTIIDVSNYGNHSNDLKNSLVLFQNGKIVYAGKYHKTKIPTNTEIINVEGKYILPGLIDCFAILNSQRQANAYLYMGITTVGATIDGSFRGDNFLTANPSPRLERMYWLDHLYEVQDTSYMSETSEDIEMVSKQIDKLIH
jgi:hypothetical protein